MLPNPNHNPNPNPNPNPDPNPNPKSNPNPNQAASEWTAAGVAGPLELHEAHALTLTLTPT